MNKILLGFIGIGLLTLFGFGTSSSVKIGEQEWMRENLNLDHFQNGDIIPEAKTAEEWKKAGNNKEPAWCYYDNNSLNGEKYGKLYNFYAVIDPRGLAPNGWHVPTDAEWTLLTDYLSANGNEGKEGDALKSKSGWNDDVDGQDGNGTDTYGWLGLPGGARSPSGNLDFIGYYGVWWSSSQYDKNNAWTRNLNYDNDNAGRYNVYVKENGFSVRCLRD